MEGKKPSIWTRPIRGPKWFEDLAEILGRWMAFNCLLKVGSLILVAIAAGVLYLIKGCG
jgi:hypothetical protein